MPDQIDYAAMPIEYRLPDSLYSYPSDGPYERFLYLSEDWYDFSHKNDDIRKGIQHYCSENNQYTDLFKGRGDYLIPNSNKVAAQILYGEEAKGRWADIPLVVKKSWLLPTDDPFLLTEMPTMVYDKDWFPNLDGSFNTIDTAQLSEMIHKNCLNDEMVLGACVWYPLKHDDGIIYYEIAEIGSGAFFLGQINAIERCLGNFGLLNGDLCEMCTGQYGAQLFKLAVGSSRFFYGNCKIAPSDTWREFFGCTPDANSPYIWKDSFGKVVLRFERIASPTREVMHEKYFRQPILFRWLCDSNWVQNKLNANNLYLRYISYKEKMP